jgi:cbb3-type cytochrome oxidase subunit 3
MKYIEYVWLASALLLMVFLAKEFSYLRPLNILVLFAGILISGFMFAYRRQSRQLIDKRNQEKMEKLQDETPQPDSDSQTESKLK